MINKSIVGDLINFRGLVYAPINENGVIFLFGKIADDLNMYIEEIKPGYPDCIGRRFVGKGWERISIEFEYKSSNFKLHGHDPKECDIIVCWEHDWKDCPLEVIELKSEIRSFPNNPIQKPGSVDEEGQDLEALLNKLFINAGANANVMDWYKKIFDQMAAVDDAIWAKVGTKYIGWYSPERAFVSVLIKKKSITFECFSRGEPIQGTIVTNQKFAPRWARFSVKSDSDITRAVEILTESYIRIKAALKAGEPTGYFSGGDPAAATKENIVNSSDEDV